MSTAEHITAWATVGATIVSVVAVVIAARSASASERSARAAENALHRSAVRELIAACHETSAEEQRVQSLAGDLIPEYTALFTFGGSSGGSREGLLKGEVEKARATAIEAAAEAKRLAEEPGHLFGASDHDMDETHARVEKARLTLRGIREKLDRDLENVRAQTQMYREKRIG